LVQKIVDKLIHNAIDFHMHTAPDTYPRSLNDIEAANQAKNVGMAAIVLKNHVTSTADRAQIARKVTEFPVFGGIVLNWGVGGLNPAAVENAIKFGAAAIWMPTIDADHFLRNAGTSIPMLVEGRKTLPQGISILDQSGTLVNEIYPILELIAEHDINLATGHISPYESLVLLKEASHIGIKKLVVTHPEVSYFAPGKDPFRDPKVGYLGYEEKGVKEIVQLGALFETVYASCTPIYEELVPPTKMATIIRAIGVENVIMASDGGQTINPSPVEMFKLFMEKMLENGISEDEIRVMTHENPAKLLHL